MRDLLTHLGRQVDSLRRPIHVQIRTTERRKLITHDLPVRALSMDGHVTATNMADYANARVKFAQQQGGQWVVRTTTSCLASAVARPVLDLFPIPPETNEMGIFVRALDALLMAYGRKLFDVEMYDAGACSLANATAVVMRELDYVFCLTKHPQELFAGAGRVLEKTPQNKALAMTTGLVGGKLVTRRLWLTTSMAGWLDWAHLHTALRVEPVVENKVTDVTTMGNRHCFSTMPHDKLTAAVWLTQLRRGWSVQNDCRNTWDKVLREDRPRG